MPTMPSKPKTTLDDLITDAIERARQDAVRETVARIGAGAESDLQALIKEEVRKLIETDPAVREQMREAILRALTTPSRRGY